MEVVVVEDDVVVSVCVGAGILRCHKDIAAVVAAIQVICSIDEEEKLI